MGSIYDERVEETMNENVDQVSSEILASCSSCRHFDCSSALLYAAYLLIIILRCLIQKLIAGFS